MRLLRIEGVERRGPGELEVSRDDAAGQPREAEGDRLVDGLAIDGQVDGQAHAPVGPERLRVPLIGEEHPLLSVEVHRLQGEPGRAPDVLGQGAPDHVGDVGFPALEHGQPRHLVGHGLEHEALDARALPPVLLVRLRAPAPRPGVNETNRYGPAPTGAFLKPSSPTFSTYFAWNDPRRAGGRGGVEGEEVGPGLSELEAHPMRPPLTGPFRLSATRNRSTSAAVIPAGSSRASCTRRAP